MKKTSTKPLPNYTFGVEIETFGVHGAVLAWGLKKAGLIVTGRHATPETPAEQRRRAREQGAWDLGDDGSIRGEHPIEIRSPVLSGRKGLKEIEKVCRVLNELGSQANASCGLHVHVGITNAEKQGEKPFTIPEILTILKRYQAWEKTIDGFVASGRREGKNTYCGSIASLIKAIDTEVEKCRVPAPVCAKVDGEWASAKSSRDPNRTNAEMLTGCDCTDCLTRAVTVENRRLQDEYNQKYQRRINLADVTTLAQFGDHYHKVSVSPLTKYGTLEFRQHHGTTKGKEITNWVRFLLNHIEVSRRLTAASEPIVTATIPAGESVPVEGSVEARKGPRGGTYKDKDVTMGLRTHVKKHFLGQKARFAPRPRRTKKTIAQGAAVEAAPAEVPRQFDGWPTDEAARGPAAESVPQWTFMPPENDDAIHRLTALEVAGPSRPQSLTEALARLERETQEMERRGAEVQQSIANISRTMQPTPGGSSLPYPGRTYRLSIDNSPPVTASRIHFEDLGTPEEIGRRRPPPNALQQNPVTGEIEQVHIAGPVSNYAVEIPAVTASPPRTTEPAEWCDTTDFINDMSANPFFLLLNSPRYRR